MRHYLRMISSFIQMAVQRETAFRANLALNLLNTILNLVAGVAGLSVLFGQVEILRGWTYPQAMVVLGLRLPGRFLFSYRPPSASPPCGGPYLDTGPG